MFVRDLLGLVALEEQEIGGLPRLQTFNPLDYLLDKGMLETVKSNFNG